MAKANKISKKAARRQVEKNLKISLAALEPIFGNKDFKRRLKNAGKEVVKGLRNKQSQMALANLKKSDFPHNGQHVAKKNGVKNLTHDAAISYKRKTAEAHS